MSHKADKLFGKSDAKYVAAMRADPAAEWKARAEKAEAELAKRERALEQAEAYHNEYIHQQIGGSTVEESVALASEKAPNYAEWLKNRGKS